MVPTHLRPNVTSGTWNAAGDSKWTAPGQHFDDPLLFLQGTNIGSISAVVEMTQDEVENGLSYWWPAVCSLAMHVQPTYLDREGGQSRMEALWRTMIADIFRGQHPAPSEAGVQFGAHFAALLGRTTANNYSSMNKLEKMVWKLRKFAHRKAN
jgi:hypothetical protein